MDKQLLDILICPICKGKLAYKAQEADLICKGCRPLIPSATAS